MSLAWEIFSLRECSFHPFIFPRKGKNQKWLDEKQQVCVCKDLVHMLGNMGILFCRQAFTPVGSWGSHLCLGVCVWGGKINMTLSTWAWHWMPASQLSSSFLKLTLEAGSSLDGQGACRPEDRKLISGLWLRLKEVGWRGSRHSATLSAKVHLPTPCLWGLFSVWLLVLCHDCRESLVDRARTGLIGSQALGFLLSS